MESLKKDTAVNVYEVVGTWLRIDVPSSGKSGFVSGKYISINASSLSAYALGVTSGKVNLRKEATSKSDSVAVVAKNSGVTIYSADKTTGWYKVKVHSTSQEGYISPSYVKIVCKVVGKVDSKEGYINANGVNLRSGAGSSYKSQGTLAQNTAVTISETSGSWYKITVKGTSKTGYVYATYVTLYASASPTPTPVGMTPTPTPATPTPTPASGASGYVNASDVNFRTGPAASYKSLGRLAKNTAVTILGTSGDWYKVTVSSLGKNGYVFAKYITVSGSGTPTPTPAGGTAGKINAIGVNFRTGPSTSYTSLGLLGKDTAVTVIGTSGKWYKVTVVSTGKTGYVYATYVTLTPASPTPTPSVSPSVSPSAPATVTPTAPATVTPTAPATVTPTAPATVTPFTPATVSPVS